MNPQQSTLIRNPLIPQDTWNPEFMSQRGDRTGQQ